MNSHLLTQFHFSSFEFHFQDSFYNQNFQLIGGYFKYSIPKKVQEDCNQS